jgi:hypothetical protein
MIHHRWISEEDLEKHTKRDWLLDVRRKFVEEELLDGEELIEKILPVAGFPARF